MLGFSGFSITLIYYLLVLSALVCIIYGAVNWNKGSDISEEEAQKKQTWMKEKLALDREVAGEGDEE
jgi:hypothetical protein